MSEFQSVDNHHRHMNQHTDDIMIIAVLLSEPITHYPVANMHPLCRSRDRHAIDQLLNIDIDLMRGMRQILFL